MKLGFITIWFLLLVSQVFTSQGQEIRGLYVNGSHEILGDPDQEDQLLQYLLQGNFNSITFYSLHNLDFRDPVVRANLRNFIRKGKSKYKLTRFGAASESFSGFINNIHRYNLDSLTLKEDRLDHYNLEFEFWSNSATAGYYCEKYLQPAGYPCNPDGAFTFVTKLLKDLRTELAPFPEIEIEMYVGWIDVEHAEYLTPLADRILFAVYRKMEADGSINLYDFPQQKQRLENLAQAGKCHILPIFSSYDGSTDPSLYTWLVAGHSPCEAWDQYSEAFEQDEELAHKEKLQLDGYQWFKYTSMPPYPMNLRMPGPIMGPRLVQAGETARYLLPPVADALRYEWQVYPPGKIFYHSAGETDLEIQFRQPGRAQLMVRALGCGKLSPFARIDIEVFGFQPADQALPETDFANIQAFVRDHSLHVMIPMNFRGPFHLIATNLLGIKLLNKHISQPGEYDLPLPNSADTSHFIQVRILHQGGSFSKNLSTQ